MDRRQFLRGSAAAALGDSSVSQKAPRAPNLLLLLAGGWRGQALPAAGDPNVKVPHIERLAAAGVLLGRTYAANPGCSPARAALFTGKFPHASGVTRDGIRLPIAERTLSGELLKAGYATAFIGKWDLDGDDEPGFVPPGPRRRGFVYWAAFNRGHRYYDAVFYRDDDKPLRGPGFEPDYQTDLAIDFIKENAGRPFFLCVSWGPPHPPLTPPPAYAGLYAPGRVSVRYNVPSDQADKTREAIAAYYGLCSAVDRNVGRLLEALDEKRIGEDTMVVFTSDHGAMLGSHGLSGAGSPFEESVRVPLAIRYPRMLRAGRARTMLASQVDLMPTLLALSGHPAPPEAQGRDLSPQLIYGSGPGPESIYCQGQLGTTEEWRMMVRGLDKLVVDRDLKVTHLYNLGQDPYERENLAVETAHGVRRDEMSALLRDWMHRVSDGSLPSGLRLRR
ncbi:MAG: sulfatase-like hydrolase/transferase [Bryobacteraceae bacterium]|nr:sulfatase-like hydrolase/transferase [Bryobacteraceae bacterium]